MLNGGAQTVVILCDELEWQVSLTNEVWLVLQAWKAFIVRAESGLSKDMLGCCACICLARMHWEQTSWCFMLECMIVWRVWIAYVDWSCLNLTWSRTINHFCSEAISPSFEYARVVKKSHTGRRCVAWFLESFLYRSSKGGLMQCSWWKKATSGSSTFPLTSHTVYWNT